MSQIDLEARRALATTIQEALEDRFGETSRQVTEDRAVLEIHDRLLEDFDEDGERTPWSASRRRSAERAVLFLGTDLPGPPPIWIERIPGGFPMGWMLIGVVLAFVAEAFDAPDVLAYVGLAIFSIGGLTLGGIGVWILCILLFAERVDPNVEQPDECWPFPDRATYESIRDTVYVTVPMNDPTPPPLEPGLAERVLTPALVVDLAAVRRNVDAVLRLTAGPARWRPHVKTAKIPEVFALYAAAGIRRFKCATTREADVLARVLRDASVPGGDVLVAHHLFGAALARLDDLASAWPGARFSTLVESVDQVDAVPASVGVFIDVDLGMGRTGIGLARRDEIVEIARAAGSRFRGLHAYDGHRHELDRAERTRLVHATYDELVGLVEALAEEDLRPKEVVTAGTPAFPPALEHIGLATLEGTVHRVSPGTVVYHDLRSAEQLPDLDKEFAATVLTRVASLPGETTFTCDAGSKAVEGTGPDRIAEVIGEPAFVALGQSEEHTVLRAAEGERPARGTVLRLVPGHVCPTVNLAESVVLVEDGRHVGTVEVAARAHETLVQ